MVFAFTPEGTGFFRFCGDEGARSADSALGEIRLSDVDGLGKLTMVLFCKGRLTTPNRRGGDPSITNNS